MRQLILFLFFSAQIMLLIACKEVSKQSKATAQNFSAKGTWIVTDVTIETKSDKKNTKHLDAWKKWFKESILGGKYIFNETNTFTAISTNENMEQTAGVFELQDSNKLLIVKRNIESPTSPQKVDTFRILKSDSSFTLLYVAPNKTLKNLSAASNEMKLRPFFGFGLFGFEAKLTNLRILLSPQK